MKAFKTLLIAAVIAVPAASMAQAADLGAPVTESEAMGLYLRGDVGMSFLEWDGGSDDSAWVFGGGIGYQYNENMRADLTVDWSGKYDVGAGSKLSNTTVLGNLYYDFANSSAFTPYVGAGVGYGWVSDTPLNGKESGLAFGLAAGASVDLTDSLALDVGYRFRDTMIKGANPMEHQVTAGIRFSF